MYLLSGAENTGIENKAARILMMILSTGYDFCDTLIFTVGWCSTRQQPIVCRWCTTQFLGMPHCHPNK